MIVWIWANKAKIAFVVLLIAVFFCGWHLRAMYDEIKAAHLLEAQIEADKKAQHEADDKLADDDKKKAAIQQKSTSLNQTWSVQRAKQNPTDCKLPVAGLSLLRDAVAPTHAAP